MSEGGKTKTKRERLGRARKKSEILALYNLRAAGIQKLRQQLKANSDFSKKKIAEWLRLEKLCPRSLKLEFWQERYWTFAGSRVTDSIYFSIDAEGTTCEGHGDNGKTLAFPFSRKEWPLRKVQLKPHVVERILQHADTVTRFEAFGVSKAWREAAKKDWVWSEDPRYEYVKLLSEKSGMPAWKCMFLCFPRLSLFLAGHAIPDAVRTSWVVVYRSSYSRVSLSLRLAGIPVLKELGAKEWFGSVLRAWAMLTGPEENDLDVYTKMNEILLRSTREKPLEVKNGGMTWRVDWTCKDDRYRGTIAISAKKGTLYRDAGKIVKPLTVQDLVGNNRMYSASS